MTWSSGVWRGERIATHDPPPKGIPNPIHDDDGAQGAGYKGSLVAGVRTYGWACEIIIEALGEGWLTEGWVDFTLKRPLFVGDRLVTTVARSDGLDEAFALECVAHRAGGQEDVVLAGSCGLGNAAWLGDLADIAHRPGEEPPPVRSTYDLDTVPLRTQLRPLSVEVSTSAAARLATEDLEIEAARYAARPPTIHPYFLAARISPLTRHNFTYGPTIHVRSQLQHLQRALAPQELTITAEIVDAYERNEHLHQVLDGVIVGDQQGKIARLRHHTIFRPRGTTMPPPIGA